MGQESYTGTAFRRAAALREGRRRRDVDGDDWVRPFHGLRAPRRADSGDDPDHVAARAEPEWRAAEYFRAHMASHEFFSHSTAALYWGIALPRRADERIHVSVLAPHRAPRGRGVRGHQLSGALTTIDRHPSGVAVTDPASTWATLGALLPHPYDLVAAGDACVREDRLPGPRSRVLAPALTTLDALAEVTARGRREGVVALRDALPRVRAGAASRPETWTRLTLVDAGLPEPAIDHDVYDARGFIGCVDLAYPERRIAIEYEGDHHRTDPAQWNRDIEKYDRLAAAGWRVIRVTREDVFSRPGVLVGRVRRALAA